MPNELKIIKDACVRQGKIQVCDEGCEFASEEGCIIDLPYLWDLRKINAAVKRHIKKQRSKKWRR